MQMKMLPTRKIHTSAMFLQTVSKGEYPGDKINQHEANNKKIAPDYFHIPLNSYFENCTFKQSSHPSFNTSVCGGGTFFLTKTNGSNIYTNKHSFRTQVFIKLKT